MSGSTWKYGVWGIRQKRFGKDEKNLLNRRVTCADGDSGGK